MKKMLSWFKRKPKSVVSFSKFYDMVKAEAKVQGQTFCQVEIMINPHIKGVEFKGYIHGNKHHTAYTMEGVIEKLHDYKFKTATEAPVKDVLIDIPL